MSDHAQNLRQAADEIRREGHAGWGNACEWAADEIERLTAALHAQPGPVNMDDVEWAGKAHLQDAQQEIERLRTRLEIDPRHPIDGIEARDATIREQDKEIARLRAAVQHEADCAEAYRAQVETMIRERDDLKHDIAEYIKITSAQAQEISTLIAERDDLRRQLAEAELDARRYRWIAGHCRSTSEHWGGRWSIVVEGPCPAKHDEEDAFDAAIDAAMGLTRPAEEA